MVDRPWWKFCGRDWLNDRELYRCSISARGLWIAMLALMNEGVPYGHLSDTNGPILPRFISENEHIAPAHCQKLIAELEEKKVFSRTEGGVIFSRRMVRDEELRLKRAAGGYLGGNPKLKDKVNVDGLHGGLEEGKHPSRVCASDSSFVSSENPNPNFSENEPGYWIERMYARHPKKKNLPLVQDWCVQAWARFPEPLQQFREIDRVHALWCATEDWRKKNGNFAPKLDEWLGDRGWTTEPVPDEDSEPDINERYPIWKDPYEGRGSV